MHNTSTHAPQKKKKKSKIIDGIFEEKNLFYITLYLARDQNVYFMI